MGNTTASSKSPNKNNKKSSILNLKKNENKQVSLDKLVNPFREGQLEMQEESKTISDIINKHKKKSEKK